MDPPGAGAGAQISGALACRAGGKKQKMPIDLQESAVVLPWVVGDGAGINPRLLTQLLQDLR